MADDVTLQDVYDVVNRIEDKLSCRVDDLEDRVNTLESFKNKVIFGFSAVTALFGIIWYLVKEKFKEIIGISMR
jgi:hypothetical protein